MWHVPKRKYKFQAEITKHLNVNKSTYSFLQLQGPKGTIQTQSILKGFSRVTC